jgi:hypothetical protein
MISRTPSGGTDDERSRADFSSTLRLTQFHPVDGALNHASSFPSIPPFPFDLVCDYDMPSVGESCRPKGENFYAAVFR